MSDKSVAIVQPYFFPYLGYYQLVNFVDTFVFYDNVNFVNRGYIHRNRILVNNKASWITLHCENKSQNKLINEILLSADDKWRNKLIRQLELAYKKAPFFDDVFPIVQAVIESDERDISRVCMQSVKRVNDFLNIDTNLLRSSDLGVSSDLERSRRLIEITKYIGGDNYINPPGGKDLYEKAYFAEYGIDLKFLSISEEVKYDQFDNDFVPNLSIIDVLMFNSADYIKSHLLNQFNLE